jgi:hypothetical protein
MRQWFGDGGSGKPGHPRNRFPDLLFVIIEKLFLNNRNDHTSPLATCVNLPRNRFAQGPV